MKTLRSYISLIEPVLLHHVKGKQGEFIQLLIEQDYISEEAFIQQICGTEKERKYYQNLKSHTLKILQALAIVSDSRGANLVKKNLDLCRKNFTIGQKFLGKGDYKEGLRLIRQAYELAIDFDFTHLACECSSILYHGHIYYDKNRKKAKFYSSQVDKYLVNYVAEKKAEHFYFQAVASKGNVAYAEELKQSVLQLKKLKGASLRLITYKATLTILYGFSVADYGTVITHCIHTLNIFKNKKGVYSSHRQFLLSKLGIAQMAIGNFNEATNSFTEASQFAPKKSLNDYILRLYNTINFLHSGQYEKAYDLYRQNRNCRLEDIKLQFAIIEAYMCFLSHMGYLQLDKKFRIGKYLNETFKAQADKRGDNIAILIAELLVYLARDRGKFIDRVEAIHNYSYRHLKGNDMARAKRFISILCKLPRANFHAVSLKRHAEKHIEFLRDSPIRIGENVTIIEVIPFEVLLEMILVRLERRVA